MSKMSTKLLLPIPVKVPLWSIINSSLVQKILYLFSNVLALICTEFMFVHGEFVLIGIICDTNITARHVQCI